MPTKEHIANFMLLAEKIFEPVREHFGVPIRISSGYRSKELNAITKGASTTSQHCKGQAIDIDMDGTSLTNKQVFDYIKDNLPFDQLIWEFGNEENCDWVHVSYVPNGRKQILKAFKMNGATKYFPYA